MLAIADAAQFCHQLANFASYLEDFSIHTALVRCAVSTQCQLGLSIIKKSFQLQLGFH